MAQVVQQREKPAAGVPELNDAIRPDRRRLTPTEGMLSVLLGAWIVFGLFIDGWAHNHQKPETALTPWHAILYSGLLASGLYAIAVARRSHREGASLWDTAPVGHRLTLVGLAIFGVGASGDMAWHSLFGVETSLSALLSPTHLVMLAGAILLLSGPFRAGWADGSQQAPRFRQFLPTLLSLALTTALVAFFFQYVTPFRRDNYGTWITSYTTLVTRFTGAGANYAENLQIVGLTALLITNAIYIGSLMLALRRWRLPFGAATVLFSSVTALVGGIDTFNRPAPLLSAVFAGLVADVLMRALRPSAIRAWAAHVVAGATSLALWGGFFAMYQLAYGIGWNAELWAGAIVMATMSSLAVSLLAFPPAIPVTVPARTP